MFTVSLILAVLALIFACLSIANRVPLWVAVLLLALKAIIEVGVHYKG